MDVYTKNYKEAFGYKTIVENVFGSAKKVILYFLDEQTLVFEKVSKIDYLENETFTTIVINYENTSFETSASNIDKIMILDY